MSKELTTQKNAPLTIQSLINSANIKEKFKDVLGKNASAFVASIIQVVNQNDMLKNADPMTIMSAAMIAATLKLPINPNLGFAYIIPYNDRKSGRQVAQFQMGYKGFIQLAMRSGQFKTISATPIYDGQIVKTDPLNGFQFDFTKKVKDSKPAGYAAYFELLNGFQKTLYMTVAELEAHGVKYSQTARKGFGLWKDNFEAMATKTVLKLLLSKFAPLSTEMETATIADQSIVKNVETLDVEYVDNEKTPDVELKTANLTSGLKIKGEKKEEPKEEAKQPEGEVLENETEGDAEAQTEAKEPLAGEFQCGKCRDITILTVDGPQECQICGANAWKVIGEAGKRLQASINKSKVKVANK